MDTCLKSEDLLSYADGEILPPEKIEHIERCEKCMCAVRRILQTKRAFRACDMAKEMDEKEKKESYLRLLTKMRYKKYLDSKKINAAYVTSASAAAIFIVFSLSFPSRTSVKKEASLPEITAGGRFLSAHLADSFQEISPSFFERERGTLVLSGNIQNILPFPERMECLGVFDISFQSETEEAHRVIFVNPFLDAEEYERENLELPVKSIKEQLE